MFQLNKRVVTEVDTTPVRSAVATRLGRGVVTVVPVTRNTQKVYPFQVLLPAVETGLATDSKAHAEQVRSIATQRLMRRIGQVSPTQLVALDDALRLHLAL